MSARVIKDFGKIETNELSLAHMQFAKGGKINPHNHPEHEVFFTTVKGNMLMSINGEEEYNLHPGEVLNFKGENTISGEALEDSEVFVYLVKRR